MTNNDDLALKLKAAAKELKPNTSKSTCAYAAFAEIASPANILALLAERDADKKRIAELVSAIGSINHGKHHEVMIPGDDEPVYWQRKEWVEWILELAAGINLEVGE